MKNSILQPRTKLVNFRVTDNEYEALRHASIACGARCLSDFARLAVLQAASSANATAAAEPERTAHLLVFDRRISAIENEIARLMDHFSPAEPVRSDFEE
jgi:hypothetical protein